VPHRKLAPSATKDSKQSRECRETALFSMIYASASPAAERIFTRDLRFSKPVANLGSLQAKPAETPNATKVSQKRKQWLQMATSVW
jgi:hypothetical protein